MCGRYTLSEMPEWSELHIRIPDALLLRPRYNAAPGAPQLVVTREPDLEDVFLNLTAQAA